MKAPLTFAALVLALVLAAACSPNPAPAVPQQAPTIAVQPPAADTAVATSFPVPTTATQSSVAPAPNLPSASGNALDIILNAEKAFTSVKSVRMTLTNTLADGTTHATTIDYLAPDRVHATIDVGGQSSEFIVIRGQGTWMKENGQWSQSGFDMSSIVFAFLDPQVVNELAKGISVNGIKNDGAATLNGVPTTVYEYNVARASPDQNNPFAANGMYKLWIGQNDGLPYLMEGNTEDATNPGQKIQTVATYDYNAHIQIEAPQ